MASEVRHQVDDGRAGPVVRFTGVLDAGTAGTFRDVLLGQLARQPDALLVDLRGLRPAGPPAAAALREVARVNAAWPQARLAVCATGDGWRDAGLPVHPGEREAGAALDGPGVPRADLALHPHVGAARTARDLVAEVCGRWGLAGLAGPVCIAVTELVNNAVEHARTPMTVLLHRRGDAVAVAVRDGSPTAPRAAGAVAPTAYGGRGLLLVDSVSRTWGSLPLPDGKVVWALVDAPDEPEPGRRRWDGAGMPDAARG